MKYRDEKQKNGSRGAYGMNAVNETRIMWHESYRVPVTVLTRLPVTVILISVSQNR